MKRFIIGFILGVIFSATLTYATMSTSRTDREMEKFLLDDSGNTAVRVSIVE